MDAAAAAPPPPAPPAVAALNNAAGDVSPPLGDRMTAPLRVVIPSTSTLIANKLDDGLD